MAKFVFRLAPVQELRRHLEDEGKDALAREKQKLTLLENEAALLRSVYLRWSARYISSAEEGVSPSEAARIRFYLDDLETRMEENAKAIAAQTDEVEKARLDLAEKVKDRKSLDKLCERQRAAFLFSENRKEELAIEEQILSRMVGS